LAELLGDLGYRVGDKLERPADVVVPEFGIVTCAHLYTREAGQVARDVMGIEGVELSSYMDGDRLIVLSRDGQAAITRSGSAFQYAPQRGDPLLLEPVLAARGLGPGPIGDAELLEATKDHIYPDAVARLWRAFHGLVTHTPDVFLSIEDGYHAGSAFMTQMIPLTAAHGSLRDTSTYGFAMSMAGDLPPCVRMSDLREELKELNIPLD
jgi:hypothetical protein